MKTRLPALLAVMLVSGARAGSHSFQLSLTPDAALFNRSERIDGFSLGLWSENPQSALALGIVNGSTGRSAGLSVALLLNYADCYNGILLASVNYTRADFFGWQGGLVNCANGRMKGCQIGVVNIAGNLSGFQIGLVNYAGSGHAGLQVGLVNLNPQNDWLDGLPEEFAPGMFFFNWRF